MEYLQRYLGEVSDTLQRAPIRRVAQVVDILDYARTHGHQVFLLGNGGSAATASHFACDLGKGTAKPGQPRVRAIALTDSMPVLSAWANDTSYEQVFAEQLDTLLNPGDVVIGISCSGASPNVLNAMRLARGHGAVTVGFTGGEGGRLAPLTDVCVTVPGSCLEQVEDTHMVLLHAICRDLRRRGQHLAGDADQESQQHSGGADNGKTPIFLDRDGVINESRLDHVLRWEDFVFLPGVFEAVWDLSHDGYRVVVVSNQAAIGRGLVSEAEVQAIHGRMRKEIERRGGRITAVLHCPHHPDAGCTCRKPKPGLLLQAAQDLGLDLKGSYIVGDSAGDVLAGLAVGAQPLLVLSGKGAQEQEVLRSRGVSGHRVVQDLRSAASSICHER